MSEAPVVLDERRLLDGAFLAPLPLDKALSHGATHILGLLTREPYSREIDRVSFLERQLARQFIARRYSEPLVHEIRRQLIRCGGLYRKLTSIGQIAVCGAVVEAIAPSETALRVHRASQNANPLRESANHGFQRAVDSLRDASQRI
ncbi:MAG: hypothetical protein AAF526_05235 [Pseudomonadota bacterium]